MMNTARVVVAWMIASTGFFAAAAPTRTVERSFTFPVPVVRPISMEVQKGSGPERFHWVCLPGLPSTADPGAPVIPVQPVRLLLPQGCGVEGVTAVTGEWHRLPGRFRLPPSQHAFPFSHAGDAAPTPPDPKWYTSSAAYPARVRSGWKILWGRGYRMVSLNLFPVRYEPAVGAVYYTREITVRVRTRSEAAPQDVMPCRAVAADRSWIEGMVQNPGLAASYRPVAVPGDGGTGRGSGPAGTGGNAPGSMPDVGSIHPYVIITNRALAADPGPDNFQALLAHRTARGLPGMIVTVEDIYATYPGADDPEKIRNFCRHAYQEWGTEYVLLGGDGNEVGAGRIVPARGMWATAEGYVENNLKADLYYACLDGSFNDDGDSKWGERTDGPGGGDVDLVAELYVGRASVETPEELHHFVAKVIAYETAETADPWWKGALFVGEFLWPNPDTWGGDYMDEVKDGSDLYGYETAGFPGDWTKSTLYERDGTWWSSQLKALLNADGVHLLNHLGHANSNLVMKLTPADAKALQNTRYFFAYSQGCLAGQFAVGDCMAEAFTNAAHGAFGAVMNDKYGWGEVGCTDGSSQYFHRQFVDALFGEGLVEAGRANADSKEDNIWCIDYKANRWCAYETNLFGDPATPLLGVLLSSKGVLSLDRGAYKDGAAVEVTLWDADLDLDGKVREEVVLPVTAAGGDGEQVFLQETGLHTGTFTGTLTVKAGAPAPGDGLLELDHGETFLVTYVDEDDGHGGHNVTVTAEGEADFHAPLLSGVHVVFVDDTRVQVAWHADEPVAGTLVYGFAPPLELEAANPNLSPDPEVEAQGLLQCSDYLFYVKAADAAGNETTEDQGGALYGFSTLQRFYPLREDLNEDPGWTITPGSAWAFGEPQGLSGDPDAGHTGPWEYGYALDGPYGNNLGAMHLESPPLDCTGLGGVTLDFWRMLPVWGSPGDNATLSVSVDGHHWKEIYHNPISAYIEPCWMHVTYDLSEIADDEPTVRLRFTMGPTDDGGVQGGWNLDDLRLSGVGTPAAAWLEHGGHVIDDGPGGNGNGFIEPCETVALPLTLFDSGLDATTVAAHMKAFTSNIVLKNDHALFPDIPHGESRTSQAPHLSFSVADGVQDGEELVFGVDWSADQGSGSFTLIEHVTCPRLVFSSAAVEDGAGDGDGALDPGETADLRVTLANTGSVDAFNVSAQLSCDLPQYVTLLNDRMQFGHIPKGGEKEGQAPYFRVAVDPAAPNYTYVTFTLTITADNHTGTDTFPVEITDCNLQYLFDLDTDPGWSCTGMWAWGVPAGKLPPKIGGGCPDPTTGFTGNHVLGYNLEGAYGAFMQAETLTSGPIDCSNLEAVKVRFKRWLGVGPAAYDHAAFQVSTDGVNWVTFWEHAGAKALADGAWVPVEYDISSLADHAPKVYLRWVMGPTGYVLVYCGWNLDDVEIWGR